MNALLKCCHQVSAFACLAVPYRAHALEGIKKSAYFASRASDVNADQCRAMLRPILRPELKYAMNKYMSYFFRPVYEGERVVDKIEASAELTNNLNQLLQSTGCGRSLQDIADGLHFRDVARFSESVPSGRVIAESSPLGGTPHALD